MKTWLLCLSVYRLREQSSSLVNVIYDGAMPMAAWLAYVDQNEAWAKEYAGKGGGQEESCREHANAKLVGAWEMSEADKAQAKGRGL